MDAREKIDNLRKARGWTKSLLATKAGLTANTVYNWYNENRFNPSRDSIEGVCVAFGISVAEFYADIETDDLSQNEIRLLEVFRKIPDKNKEKAISVLEMLIE